MNAVPVQGARLSAPALLAGTRFFGQLARPQLERLGALCVPQRFPDGSLIYTIGDPARTFYVLVEGMVRFTIALGGRQTPAGQMIRHGEVFGWAALVEPTPRRIASAVCASPCTVLAIDGQQLLQFAETDHEVGYRVMKQLSALISANLTSFAAG